MKNRDLYLNKLIAFKDKPLIKVITGMRRCGKSTLLDLFKRYLMQSGVSKDHIVSINFESMTVDDIKNYKELYTFIKGKISASGKTYILLDEVQQVVSWEKAVNSFTVDFDVDIYITGSNAYLLSSELSTLLSGRYVEIKMLPLSFKEYLDFNDFGKNDDPALFFERYLQYGGLPAITVIKDSPETISPFLSGVYNTVIMKDVVERNEVRDAALLESVVKFVVSNVGSLISTKKISDYLTSAGRKTTSETIDNYLKMLESAFIIYRANRYDLKGKMYLKTQEKYYVVDTGIRNELLGFRDTDYGYILENVVYFELLRQGFEVAVGKIGTLEVDFVATKPDKKIYYQVSATILDRVVREREIRPLLGIQDNYEKVILTMDRSFVMDYEGVRVENILDFLMK